MRSGLARAARPRLRQHLWQITRTCTRMGETAGLPFRLWQPRIALFPPEWSMGKYLPPSLQGPHPVAPAAEFHALPGRKGCRHYGLPPKHHLDVGGCGTRHGTHPNASPVDHGAEPVGQNYANPMARAGGGGVAIAAEHGVGRARNRRNLHLPNCPSMPFSFKGSGGTNAGLRQVVSGIGGERHRN